jgi:integrase
MRHVLTSENCRLLATFPADGDRRILLWNAFIATMYGTGALPFELLALRWGDLSRDADGLTTLHFERRVARTVPLIRWSSQLLTEYGDSCAPVQAEAPMFARGNKPLAYSDVQWELERRSKVLGLAQSATTTDIRRACVRDLLNDGMKAEDICDLLGLKDPNRVTLMVESLHDIKNGPPG